MIREAEITLDDGTVERIFAEYSKAEGWIAYGDGLGTIEEPAGLFQRSSVDAIFSLAAWNGFKVTNIRYLN
jgi:hypothetical protein